MKRIISIALVMLALNCTNSYAQLATSTNIEILKAQQPAVMANYAFSEDLLLETIKKKFEDAKVSGPDKAKGGFKVYKGASFSQFGTEKFDIYFKTDGKKENSVCYMALSRGYDNFVNKEKDEVVFLAMMDFLNNLKDDAAKVQLQHDVDAAKESSEKIEKAYNGSVNDGTDYQKDLEKLQKKIEENKAEQAKKLQEWNDAKAKLEALKARQN